MPSPDSKRKKEIERWFLEAARRAAVGAIPDGKIEDFEEPDFKIHSGAGVVGVELTEVLRAGKGPIPPVAQEKFHAEVIQIAKGEYNRIPDQKPVRVLACFWDAGSGRRDKREMARALAEFVAMNRVKADPYVTFSRHDNLPEGFGVIHIDTTGDVWSCGEGGVTELTEIYDQMEARIGEKNALLPRYRTNLPGVPIWLLLYSSFGVSRGVPIPHMGDKTFRFDFDKVLFFSCLSPEVVEVCRG